MHATPPFSPPVSSSHRLSPPLASPLLQDSVLLSLSECMQRTPRDQLVRHAARIMDVCMVRWGCWDAILNPWPSSLHTPHLTCPTMAMLLSRPTLFTPSGAAGGRVHGPAPRQAAARRHEPRRPSPGGSRPLASSYTAAAAAGRSRSVHIVAEDRPGHSVCCVHFTGRCVRGVGPALHRPHRYPAGMVAGYGLHRLPQVRSTAPGEVRLYSPTGVRRSLFLPVPWCFSALVFASRP